MSFKTISDKKVVDFIPSRPCKDSLYAPFHFRSKDGSFEAIYTMGGRIDNAPFDDGTPTPEAFVDKIMVSVKQPDGKYSSPKIVIGPAQLPWMPTDYAAKRFSHPTWYCDSCCSPSVFQLEDVYYMVFTYTINASALGTGEHTDSTNPSKQADLRKYWGYFALGLAESDDGITWRPISSGRSDNNPALQYAHIWREPTESDKALIEHTDDTQRDYKGIASASAVLVDEYLYIVLGTYMGPAGQKNGLVRIKIGSPFWEICRVGLSGPKWEILLSGRLPAWFNINWAAGNIHPWIASGLTKTSIGFILTFDGAGQYIVPGGSGLNNCLGYTVSNDPTNWAAPVQAVVSTSPTINGKGTDGIVLNSSCYEQDGKIKFLYATADNNGDGVPDCSGFSPYVGLAVHEIEVETV